ncbi:MAG: DUF421 domain-containing protein [Ruminococcus sp.]|nr:DUF421 domain-containing protein [Ruminococcus sp.]MDD6634786.1 DUF421 domain-containing protein [Ruminococcus sp.]MDY3844326.1 DUF421 domain-containing protein [Ruminococcus sp.]CDF03025.1 putative uncharacterized protein [Ruminococcus sp. CAG:624]
MSIVLIRSILLYILVILSVRLMGKRQLGELQPSELVITILISNIATLPLEDLHIPLITGITPILALMCFEVIMSHIIMKFSRFRCIVSGRPKIIISNGVINQKVMKDLRYTIDDLMTALRGNGVFSPEEVQFAIVETTGSISVLKKAELDTVTCRDMKIKTENSDPPQIIITDGKLLESSVKSVGLTMKWLEKTLNKEKKQIQNIFLMTADNSGKYYIVEKGEEDEQN